MPTQSYQTQFIFSPNRFSGLVLVVLIAALYATYLFPTDFIKGTSSYWLAQNEDVTQYIAGFNAYFSEPWHWPLWKIGSLNWPQGTLTTFVDVIPLYSAILKLIAPASWFPFNPFGFWLLLCIFLQAIGSWWIVREAQITSWIALIALTVLLLTFPSWLNRFVHISLFSHWILLFSFALVLQEQRTKHLPNCNWFILLLCAFFINIYLFTMILAIFASQWLSQDFVAHRIRILYCTLLMLAIFILAASATMWPLPAANGGSEYGFGIYSLNLLSPISGGSLWQVSPDSFSSEQHFEGFNYLGFGILTLLISCLIGFIKQRWNQSCNRTNLVWPLSVWITLLLMMVYAFSNRIYWGDQLLYEWVIPHWALPLTGQFRASGRFFWPIAYALTIFVFICVYRLYTKRTANIILCVVCALQIIDLSPLIMQTRALLSRISPPIIDHMEWQKLLPPQTQTLYLYPKLKCNKNSSFLEIQLPFMRYASENHFNINTGYIARYNPACSQEALEIAQSNFQSSAYIFVNAEYSDSTIESFFPSQKAFTCEKFKSVTLCLKRK